MTDIVDAKLILENQLAMLWALYDMKQVLGIHNNGGRLELERCMEQTRQRIASLAAPYSGEDDHRKSYHACLDAVRERVQAGGETWKPKEPK